MPSRDNGIFRNFFSLSLINITMLILVNAICYRTLLALTLFYVFSFVGCYLMCSGNFPVLSRTWNRGI